MEAVYYAARANLQRLLRHHPDWTRSQLAQATGMSVSWIDKWKKRLLQALTMMSRYSWAFTRSHHPCLDLSRRWWTACWRFGIPLGELGSHSRP